MEKIKKILSNNLNLLLLFDIILLLVAVVVYFQEIDISYSFYTFLKWIISFSFCFLTYALFKNNPNSKLILLYIIMFILFNPLKPMYFEQEVWLGIDIFTLLLLFVHFCMINSIHLIQIFKENFLNFIKKFLIHIGIYDVQIDKSDKCNDNILKRLKCDKLKKLIYIFFFVMLFISGVAFIIFSYSDISEIKKNAYKSLIYGDKIAYNVQLSKLSKYGIKPDIIKSELENNYKDEIKPILDDIAYNYKHNKNKFSDLKKEYLIKFFDNNENSFNNAIGQILDYKEASWPQNGIVHNYTETKTVVPLIIKIRDRDDHKIQEYYDSSFIFGEYHPEDSRLRYVKLVDSRTQKTKVIIFFPGEDAIYGKVIKVKIPVGNYKVKVASGNTWYGEEHLFGINTIYETSDKLLTVKNSKYPQTLTLYSDFHGDFLNKEITSVEF